MRYYFLFLIILNSVIIFSFGNDFWSNWDLSNKAIITVPVVDAVSNPLSKTYNLEFVENLYKILPYSPHVGNTSCLRLHQLLFNEVVTVKRVYGQELECEFDSLFYYNGNKLQRNFWIDKKNIKYLQDFKKADFKCIPAPYKNTFNNNISNTLTLSHPWYDDITKRYYSAGTRFVYNSSLDILNCYGISLYNFDTLQCCISYVPKNIAIVDYSQSIKDRIKLFIKLIRDWIQSSTKVIPYVWGGCSYISRCNDKDFKLIKSNMFNKPVEAWDRIGSYNKPYTGFECSSLILRAAQIYGLPYFCKNTSAISKTLRPLDKGEELTEGDLIWYSGHVLIISDIKSNKLIESVGYFSGYGKLHEIELGKVFQNIKNYGNLLDSYFSGKSLNRLDINSNVIRKVPKFLILKISSIDKIQN